MVSVDSPDSDSDSEDYLANMAGMFTADRMSVLPCHVGTKLLLSVQYECVPCTSLRPWGRTWDALRGPRGPQNRRNRVKNR